MFQKILQKEPFEKEKFPVEVPRPSKIFIPAIQQRKEQRRLRDYQFESGHLPHDPKIQIQRGNCGRGAESAEFEHGPTRGIEENLQRRIGHSICEERGR